MGFFDDLGRGIGDFFTGNWSDLSDLWDNSWIGQTGIGKFISDIVKTDVNIVNGVKDFFNPDGKDVSPSDDSSDIFKDWDSVDFSSMSEDEMRKWLLNHSESVTPENLSILNGWLNDKYNEGRESSQISRYMEQLKENGINPLMMFGHGAPTGIGTSGAATRLTSAPEGGLSEYQSQMLDMRFIALILAGLRLMI